MPIIKITIFVSDTLMEIPEIPIRLTVKNTKGPAIASTAFSRTAYSTLFIFKNNIAAKNSRNAEINRMAAIDTIIGFINISPFMLKNTKNTFNSSGVI
jgi:hypothetical protein